MGPIPASILQLRNLEFLNLASNNLSGTVELEKLLTLKNLNILILSQNKLSVLANVTTPRKFLMLGLGSCNLGYFPIFLRDQNQLQWLDLSRNKIHGLIPKYIWEVTKDTLQVLVLSANFLTGFEEHPFVFPWTKLTKIKISHNKLQGRLPIPPPSTRIYSFSGNNFTGEISPLICGLSSLLVLDLSENNLSGKLLECLGNFSNSLVLLNLTSNNLQGEIPQMYTKGCSLMMFRLDDNNLEGQLPRALADCRRRKFLSVGFNKVTDTFPCWLGGLQELNVLVLQSNQFHGNAGSHAADSGFPNLKVIDLSRNNFSGQLPTNYFLNWNAMKIVGTDGLTYMGAVTSYDLQQAMQGMKTVDNNSFSMSIINKGTELEYEEIPESFVVIDLSSNIFEGNIPEVIGDLKGLHLLNLSNNVLNGPIPSSLGDLRLLESLDLSQNKLSGEIPKELVQLTFLAIFNVSNNNITGRIPSGNQFDTFLNDSYEGNSGLCGSPLSSKCGNSSSGEDKESGSQFEFGWKPVVIGYSCGLLIGLLTGHLLVTTKYDWFLKTFRLRQTRRTRTRGRTRSQRRRQ